MRLSDLLMRFNKMACLAIGRTDPDPYSRLYIAIRMNDGDEIKDLIKKGIDVNVTDHQGKTALHAAARWGRTDIVTLLVKAGADINARDEQGATPLHDCGWWGHTETALQLLQMGADPYIKNNDDNTVIDVAYLRGGRNAFIKSIQQVLESIRHEKRIKATYTTREVVKSDKSKRPPQQKGVRF